MRINFLDDLRGCLSWWVVIIHAFWLTNHRLEGFWLNGNTPVNLFVVLSGYCITQLLLSKRETFGAFILRRWFRLFPAFFVCLLFAIVVRPLTVGTNALDLARETSEGTFWWQHLAAHFLMLHGAVSAWLSWSGQALLPPAWSISLEWQLYLIAPAMVWLTCQFPKKAIFGLTCFALLPLRHWHEWGNDPWATQKFVFFWVGTLAAFIPCRTDSIVTKRPVTFLGRLGMISYSTYLCHFPILALIHAFWSTNNPWLLFAVCAPLVLAASIGLYRWVELPGMALGRQLLKKEGLKRYAGVSSP